MKLKNRVKPKYLVAALWIFWILFLPLNSFWEFAALVVLSITLSRWAKKKWPAGADEGSWQENRQAEYGQNGQPGQPGQPGFGGTGQERVVRPSSEYVDAEVRPAPPKEDASYRSDRASADRTKAAENSGRDSSGADGAEEGRKAKRRPRTGDQGVDKLLDEEEKAIAELKRLNDAIPDPKMTAQIDHLEEVTTKIVNFIIEHPEKKSDVSRFFNYYLPTTIKFLNAYDRMDDVGIQGANIDGTKGNVERMMDTALAAFDKQLDALYSDEALDISTDIKVMEGLLAQDGLTDKGLFGK